MNANILLVEDEYNLGATLKDYLEDHGHIVTWAQTFEEAIKEIKKPQVIFQVALLDIGLPDGDGIELAKIIKASSENTSFMFLSAQNDPDIKVKGLETGAQDYMTKPFNIKELSFRLKKMLTHFEQTQNSDEYVFGPLKVWFKQYQVQNAQGESLSLGTKECEILKLLIDSSPNVISRDDIINQIWGADANPSYRTVDNYIVTLRKWAETDPGHHLVIHTVRGIGYKLEIKN